MARVGIEMERRVLGDDEDNNGLSFFQSKKVETKDYFRKTPLKKITVVMIVAIIDSETTENKQSGLTTALAILILEISFNIHTC